MEAISKDDLLYYQKCQENVRQVQTVLQHFGAFLVEKYKIGQEDRIEENGSITRGTPPKE